MSQQLATNQAQAMQFQALMQHSMANYGTEEKDINSKVDDLMKS
jgi:hypothetical protein